MIEVEHGGVNHARNAGLASASGAAVRFVDSDDVIEPGSTARLLRLSDGRAIGYGDTLVCDSDLRPEKLVQASIQGDALTPCILGDFFVYITAMVFPKEVVAVTGEFDTDFDANEDYDFVLRALEHAPVRGEHFVASRYRRHEESITGRQRPDEVRSSRALEKLFERRPDLRGTSVERAARAHLRVNEAARLMHAGRYGAAARGLLSALRLSRSQAGPEALPLLRSFPRLIAGRALTRGRRAIS